MISARLLRAASRIAWRRVCADRRASIGSALLLVVLTGPLSAQPAPPGLDIREIRLKIGTFDPLDRIPSHPGLPEVAAYAAGVRGGYLVQFDHPIGQSDRQAIEAAGGSIKGYIPMMTLEVVMTEQVRGSVQGLAGVRWVGVYQPSFKVSAGLLETAAADPSAQLNLQVSLFPGEGDLGVGAVRGLGATVTKRDRGRSFELVVAEIPAGQLNALVRLPQVRYVEPVYQRVPLNDRGRFLTGLTDIADDTFSYGIDPSLDGLDETSGFQVKYGHFDTGLDNSHGEFTTATVTVEAGSTTSGSSVSHGTHTASSIVGDGSLHATITDMPPNSGTGSPGSFPNRWRGVTPQAALHHMSFSTGFTDSEIFEKEVDVGAQISSNSWGYCIPRGPFCDSIMDYNSNAAVWDAGVWDADLDDTNGRQPLITFFSAGNDASDPTTGGCGVSEGDQIGTPGTAKNVITVGATETDRGGGCGLDGDNPDDAAFFSSRGPVDPDAGPPGPTPGQGLFKPDVVNVGTFVLSAESPTGSGGTDWDSTTACGDSGTSYAYNGGTSMSTPLTAGLGGVLLQDLVVNLGVSEPRPSLVKALLINGAVDLTSPTGACDYTFETTQASIAEGWGRVSALNSMYGPGGTKSQRNIGFENEENAVETGGTYMKQLSVTGNTPLKITLVWTDYPASAGAGSPLVVNDLDLKVTGPGPTVYLGNNFSGNWSVTGGSEDRYNVVENVYIQNPASGDYTVEVIGFQVSQDQEPDTLEVTDQDFSLVWSGDAVVPPCGPGRDLLNSRWRMISLPCQPTSAVVEDLFAGQSLGVYGTDWILFERDEANQEYDPLTELSVLQQGVGYWFKALSPARWAMDGTATPTTANGNCPSANGCFEIPLLPPSSEGSGLQNLAGHPLPYPVDWADVVVEVLGSAHSPSDAENNGDLSKTFHLYNGSAYEAFDDVTPGMVGALRPAEGMWVKVLDHTLSFGDISLLVPATPAGAAAASSSSVATPIRSPTGGGQNQPDPRRRRGNLFAKEWYIRLIAEAPADGLKDRGNVLGQLETGKQGYDLHDLEEPPPFGTPYLTIVFPHPHWGKRAGDYTSDYHRLRWGKFDQWRFEVRSDDPNREVTLSWSAQGEHPQEAWLRDEKTGQVIPMSAGSYTFTMGQGVRSFNWTVWKSP